MSDLEQEATNPNNTAVEDPLNPDVTETDQSATDSDLVAVNVQPYTVQDEEPQELEPANTVEIAVTPDRTSTLAAQSQSLLKPDGKRSLSQPSNDKLIDASSENYYSANVLNLHYNPNSKSRFGLASYYMTYINSFSSFMMGLAAFAWYQGSDYIYRNNITSTTLCMVTGMYCFFIAGIGAFIWNLLYGKQRKLTAIPYRSILFFALSIIPFFTYVTSIIGVLWLICFAFSLLAWKNGEEFLYKDGQKESGMDTVRKYASSVRNNCCSGQFYKDWYKRIKQQNELKKYAFFAIYSLINFVYCSYQFAFYVDQVHLLNDCATTSCAEGVNGISGADLNFVANENGSGYEARIVTMLFPIAKFMGNLLDINCAFILFPVCRSFITKLYNMSTDQRSAAKCCNAILSFFPLDSAIELHIFMSGLIVIGTVVHTWGHYLHYSQVPLTYHEVYGDTVWISGALIVIAMVLIYSTSLAAVRYGKYELFWYTHHLFVVFFIATIFHGRNGFGPNFWKWMIVPGALYITERILREYRAAKPVGVLSISHMNNDKAKVYAIELEKVHHLRSFREGQYVFLKAPTISKMQWHPFTISSPPEQKTLTIHIRNMGEGSWTDRLQQYFEAFSPNKCYTELFHRDGHHLVPQAKGPDGNNLICIDGPISAPTQHLGEYHTSMVIGAGIGVTPMRAALLSIVYYRFKMGIGHSFPDNAYCVWIVNYKQLSAYKWMCRTLKEVEDELYNMRDKSVDIKEKVLQIHIFVTSVPDIEDTDEVKEDEKMNDISDRYTDLAVWGTHYDDMLHDENDNQVQRGIQAPFDEIAIWNLLKKPTEDPQQMGDIFVHKGRPKWDILFEPIQEKHRGHNIGVMFCGPHIIASDLQNNCAKYTDFESETRFIFHKENY